jgi:hypothetical protein
MQLLPQMFVAFMQCFELLRQSLTVFRRRPLHPGQLFLAVALDVLRQFVGPRSMQVFNRLPEMLPSFLHFRPHLHKRLRTTAADTRLVFRRFAMPRPAVIGGLLLFLFALLGMKTADITFVFAAFTFFLPVFFRVTIFLGMFTFTGQNPCRISCQQSNGRQINRDML